MSNLNLVPENNNIESEDLSQLFLEKYKGDIARSIASPTLINLQILLFNNDTYSNKWSLKKIHILNSFYLLAKLVYSFFFYRQEHLKNFSNRKSVFSMTLASTIRLSYFLFFFLVIHYYAVIPFVKTHIYDIFFFSKIAIAPVLFIIIMEMIYADAIYGKSKLRNSTPKPIFLTSFFLIFYFSLACLQIKYNLYISLREAPTVINTILASFFLFFWRENTKFVTKWDYAANLYNKIYFDSINSDQLDCPTILQMNLALSIDLLELHIWSHRSFINSFISSIEVAINWRSYKSHIKGNNKNPYKWKNKFEICKFIDEHYSLPREKFNDDDKNNILQVTFPNKEIDKKTNKIGLFIDRFFDKKSP